MSGDILPYQLSMHTPTGGRARVAAASPGGVSAGTGRRSAGAGTPASGRGGEHFSETIRRIQAAAEAPVPLSKAAQKEREREEKQTYEAARYLDVVRHNFSQIFYITSLASFVDLTGFPTIGLVLRKAESLRGAYTHVGHTVGPTGKTVFDVDRFLAHDAPRVDILAFVPPPLKCPVATCSHADGDCPDPEHSSKSYINTYCPPVVDRLHQPSTELPPRGIIRFTPTLAAFKKDAALGEIFLRDILDLYALRYPNCADMFRSVFGRIAARQARFCERDAAGQPRARTGHEFSMVALAALFINITVASGSDARHAVFRLLTEAHALELPGARTNIYSVILGKSGIGKDWPLDVFRALLGTHLATTIVNAAKYLYGDFDPSDTLDRTVICVTDPPGGISTRAMRGQATSSTRVINPKGQEARRVRWVARVFITYNGDVALEEGDDRRAYVRWADPYLAGTNGRASAFWEGAHALTEAPFTQVGYANALRQLWAARGVGFKPNFMPPSEAGGNREAGREPGELFLAALVADDAAWRATTFTSSSSGGVFPVDVAVKTWSRMTLREMFTTWRDSSASGMSRVEANNTGGTAVTATLAKLAKTGASGVTEVRSGSERGAFTIDREQLRAHLNAVFGVSEAEAYDIDGPANVAALKSILSDALGMLDIDPYLPADDLAAAVAERAERDDDIDDTPTQDLAKQMVALATRVLEKSTTPGVAGAKRGRRSRGDNRSISSAARDSVAAAWAEADERSVGSDTFAAFEAAGGDVGEDELDPDDDASEYGVDQPPSAKRSRWIDAEAEVGRAEADPTPEPEFTGTPLRSPGDDRS